MSILKNRKHQAIRLPADMAHESVREREICPKGDVITLRPVRPSWASLLELPMADADFLEQRPVVIGHYGKVEL